MNDADRAKQFVLAWARYTIALSGAEQAALNELKDKPAAHQLVRAFYQRELSGDSALKQIALQMALAEFQILVDRDSR